jgi:hypothetical protein
MISRLGCRDSDDQGTNNEAQPAQESIGWPFAASRMMVNTALGAGGALWPGIGLIVPE